MYLSLSETALQACHSYLFARLSLPVCGHKQWQAITMQQCYDNVEMEMGTILWDGGEITGMG